MVNEIIIDFRLSSSDNYIYEFILYFLRKKDMFDFGDFFCDDDDRRVYCTFAIFFFYSEFSLIIFFWKYWEFLIFFFLKIYFKKILIHIQLVAYNGKVSHHPSSSSSNRFQWFIHSNTKFPPFLHLSAALNHFPSCLTPFIHISRLYNILFCCSGGKFKRRT